MQDTEFYPNLIIQWYYSKWMKTCWMKNDEENNGEYSPRRNLYRGSFPLMTSPSTIVFSVRSRGIVEREKNKLNDLKS